MAVRGGRGGDPAAFGMGGGEGSGKKPATAASGVDNPHEGYDYDGEWSNENPPLKRNEPAQVSMTDSDGLERFTPGTKEHFDAIHANKRWKAWSDARSRLGTAQTDSGSAGDGRIRRIKPEEKANVKGARVTNPTKTSEFLPLLDQHYKTLSTIASGLNAVAARDGNPGRKSPLDAGAGIAAAVEQAKKMAFESKGKPREIREAAKRLGEVGIMTAKNRAESARIKLSEANNHLSDYKTHIQRGNDFQQGTNISGLNPTLMRSATAEANKHYKAAAGSLKKAHDALTHDDVNFTLGPDRAAQGLDKNSLTNMLNLADKLPVPKQQGKAPTRFQFGARGFERVLRQKMSEAGISGKAADEHLENFRKGNIVVGSPLHEFLLDRAKEHADATGDKGPLEKLQRLAKPVRTMTKAEKNVVKTKKMGFGSLAGGTKTVEAMQEAERQAEEVGQGGQGTGVQGALDSTDHGIDTRVADPKKTASRASRTGRISTPIPGPTIGKNVPNVRRRDGKGEK